MIDVGDYVKIIRLFVDDICMAARPPLLGISSVHFATVLMVISFFFKKKNSNNNNKKIF